MRIQQKTSLFNSSGWLEADDGRTFRRVVGGVAWPFSDKPGFIVVVGEDFQEDMDYQVRHLRVLGEWREHLGLSFVELRPMLACMAYLRREMCARPWYGEVGPWSGVIANFNTTQAKLRQMTVSIYPPPGKMDFSFHANLVRRRVMHEKTLHIGVGVLSSKLSLLPTDLSQEKHVEHPEVAALFYALAGLDLTKRMANDILKRQYGMADRAGGY